VLRRRIAIGGPFARKNLPELGRAQDLDDLLVELRSPPSVCPWRGIPVPAALAARHRLRNGGTSGRVEHGVARRHRRTHATGLDLRRSGADGADQIEIDPPEQQSAL
jgi:hypothetical protein